ncbi:Hypothetical protein PSEBR_m264 [Pseudomonas brassicacearum subsp. brassicacearum NFM421]|uniref:Uncharacterized protein n=1 Tax=Pseudomonas brassicacearum (strain NFM421) TaxID=994484 RepID=F2KBV5_PSEBN|nr:Hypothetical protein PSEBR_m264 [Pseudomonas brassicacearum subsp. brassicacearum NFM421]
MANNTRFDHDKVEKQLGFAVSGSDEYMCRMRHPSECKVQWHEALSYFMSFLCDTSPGRQPAEAPAQRTSATQGGGFYKGHG